MEVANSPLNKYDMRQSVLPADCFAVRVYKDEGEIADPSILVSGLKEGWTLCCDVEDGALRHVVARGAHEGDFAEEIARTRAWLDSPTTLPLLNGKCTNREVAVIAWELD